jgi:hypothetical protein
MSRRHWHKLHRMAVCTANEGRKQIVLSSDRFLMEMQDIEENRLH